MFRVLNEYIISFPKMSSSHPHTVVHSLKVGSSLTFHRVLKILKHQFSFHLLQSTKLHAFGYYIQMDGQRKCRVAETKQDIALIGRSVDLYTSQRTSQDLHQYKYREQERNDREGTEIERGFRNKRDLLRCGYFWHRLEHLQLEEC